MAGAPTTEGYQSIRDFVQSEWDFVELRDGSGTPITRIPSTDPRFAWEHAANAQVLVARVTVKGSDADIPVPCTIAQSALFRVASGGSPMASDAFQYAQVIGSDNDELVVRHEIAIPKVV